MTDRNKKLDYSKKKGNNLCTNGRTTVKTEGCKPGTLLVHLENSYNLENKDRRFVK